MKIRHALIPLAVLAAVSASAQTTIWRCGNTYTNDKAEAQSKGCKAVEGGNVTVVCRDGSKGYPEQAPYDGISVAAAAPDVPERLLEQLAEGGRLVIPVGDVQDQELRVILKKEGELSTRISTHCRFVPLRGHYGFH